MFLLETSVNLCTETRVLFFEKPVFWDNSLHLLHFLLIKSYLDFLHNIMMIIDELW